MRALGGRTRFIRGNADREIVETDKAGLAPPEIMEFVRGRLSEGEIEFLGALPLTESVEVDGLGTVLFCHATPRSDEEILTRISPDERWQQALDGVDADVVVCGHTHVQFDRDVAGVRLVNAGSVGMPYEDEPGAYWALLGPRVELRRTSYEPGDLASSGWPEDELPTATAEQATEHFEKVARERA